MSKKENQIKQFLKYKLRTDSRWAIRALTVVYAHQTTQEQRAQTTIEDNGVGFSGADAELLSSFAEQCKRRGLSEKQMIWLHKKIHRYWQQIYQLSDKQKLEILLEQYKAQVLPPVEAKEAVV